MKDSQAPSPVHAPRSTSARQRGFTLLELMAVVLIMGGILLLVPAGMQNVGSQGALKDTANSLVAAFNGTRDRAILDAYEVHLEIGTFRDDEDNWLHGWRWKFTNLPPPEVVGGGDDFDETDVQERRQRRRADREWLHTSWKETSGGVTITGVSTRRGTWNKVESGAKPTSIRFFGDGTVESGVAVRLVNEDMETDVRYKTITVFVNALTSESSWEEGEHELSESIAASSFGGG